MVNQKVEKAIEMPQKGNLNRILVPAILIVLLAWPFFFGNSYTMHVAVIALLGAMATLGYNIFFGYMGQVNFGPIAFYGIGAYAAALMQVKMGVPYPLAIFIIAPLAAAAVAVVISFPMLRLKGHTLALGTLAFAYMMYLIIDRWTSFTGGGNGIYVKPPEILGVDLRNGIGYYYIVLICAVAVFALCYWLVSSKHGRAMKAIRADEVGAAAMGVDVMGYKRTIYVLSASIIGLAGGLLSQQAGLLGPDYASIAGNILLILMVVTGGLRSNVGAVLGGVFISLLPVMLAGFVEWAVVIYSAILLLVLRFMPTGIVGVVRKIMKLPASL